jgi:8-oxo-dGTP pyrophosphatase MutT (NUDIX family)
MKSDSGLLARLRAIGHPLSTPPVGRPWNQSEIDDLVGTQDALCPAAVLVPIVARSSGASLILTRRTDSLRHHAGQISFPGGRIEPGDASPLAAALREAQEEIGLDPAQTDALGYLDPLATITGFRVVPVLGILEEEPRLHPDPSEVAEMFEVPLDFVLDPANLQEHAREFRGRVRHYHVIQWQHYDIWGATASMIANLAAHLRGELGR